MIAEGHRLGSRDHMTPLASRMSPVPELIAGPPRRMRHEFRLRQRPIQPKAEPTVELSR